jgi:hypothetical protein
MREPHRHLDFSAEHLHEFLVVAVGTLNPLDHDESTIRIGSCGASPENLGHSALADTIEQKILPEFFED